MSHFSYTRANWSSGSDLFASEMASIDAKTYKAVNGDEGGTWAPSSVITIGGSGMNMTGPALFAGLTTTLAGTTVEFLDSPVTLDSLSTLTVNSSSSFSGPSQFSSTLTALGQVEVLAGLTVNGSSSSFQSTTVSFDAASSVTVHGAFSVPQFGSVNVDAPSSFTRGLTSTSVTTISGPLTASGGITGITHSSPFLQPDADGTLDPRNYNSVYCATITATRVVQISDPFNVVADGAEVDFMTSSTAASVTIKDPAGGTLQTIRQLSGNYFQVKVKKVNNVWKFWSGTLS